MKIQQGFGGLSVVLCSQTLATLEKLLHLNISVSDPMEESSHAGFDITETYTHSQRMRRLLDVPFTSLLFSIGTICYRKSCNLKRIQKNSDGETVMNQSGIGNCQVFVVYLSILLQESKYFSPR